MPLDRYNGGATPFSPTSSVGYQAQAQTMGTLTERLDEWNQRAFEVGKLDAAQRGQEDAINKMVSGDPLKMEDGFSYYAQAYNDITKSAYNIQVESDLKRKAEELQAKDPLNPTKFNEVFDSYAKGAMGKIEDSRFKAIYMQQAQKIGATYYTNMVKSSYENSQKNALEVVNAGLSDVQSSYYASFANGNVEEATHHIATYTALLDAKVKAGQMDERLIPFELKKLQKGAMENKAMLELDNSINNGETDYIERYMKSPEYNQLSFDEKTAITKRMHEHIDVKYKAMSDEASGNDKMLEAVSKRNTASVMKRVYNGEKVSDQELRDMVVDGRLSRTAYNEIAQEVADLKGGSSVDDSQVVTDYELHIETVSPRTIAQDGRLTAKTKQRLISKVIAHKETVNGNKALADAFKSQRNTLGKTSWQMANEYLNANIFDDDPDKEKNKRLSILNRVRDEVEAGKVNPLEAHERTQELADDYNNKNKAKNDSMRYDREMKKYTDEVTAYRRNTQGTWNKMWNSVGKPLQPPKEPVKPSNYIPKSQRN